MAEAEKPKESRQFQEKGNVMNAKYQSLPKFEPRVLQGYELELVSGAAVTNGNYSTAGTSSCCHRDGTNDNDTPAIGIPGN